MSEPGVLAAAEASLAICLRVLRAVGTDQGTASTPCKKFTVDDLLDHMMGSFTGLAAVAGRPFEAIDGTPEERVADAGFRSIEAWRARGLDGTVPLGGQEAPAELAASIVPIELLVHAWDLAKAAGLEFTADDKLAAYVLEFAHKVIAPRLRDGDQFDAEIAVGPDADAVDRLVAFTGRAA